MNVPEAAVGMILATQVADRLEAGAVLAFSHRDYCGTGLRCVEGEFIYGQVYDGRLSTSAEAPTWLEESDSERKVFFARDDFISWLAAQTDESLSGKKLRDVWHHNNGRLTIERLQRFVQEMV